MTDELIDHLGQEVTSVCRLWKLVRADGEALGFTDHDRDLIVDGLRYRANSGLSASALQQASGLAVDNSEAVGALSDGAIGEADLTAGRFDGAEVRVWLANWMDPRERREIFRGTLGEVTRRGHEFQAELRGLTEPLNQQTGHVYSRMCSAVLGDGRCRFDLDLPGYRVLRAVESVDDEQRIFTFASFTGFDERWFDHGRLDVMSGAAKGLFAMIKTDRQAGEGRRVELWQGIRAPIAAGDTVRLTAGCDKRAETCRVKFDNMKNFRGFPHLPGEDWLVVGPGRGGQG